MIQGTGSHIGKTLLVANTASWVVGALGLGLGFYIVLSSDRARTRTELVISPRPGSGQISIRSSF